MTQKEINETISVLEDEEFLTDDEIEEYLNNLKNKLPSFVILLLKNNLRGKKVTKRQLDRIVERISEVLTRGKEDKTEELTKKLQSLEQKLDTIMKLTTVAVSSKLSEELESVEETPEIVKESIDTSKEVSKKDISSVKVESVEAEEPITISEAPKESIIETPKEESEKIEEELKEEAISEAPSEEMYKEGFEEKEFTEGYELSKEIKEISEMGEVKGEDMFEEEKKYRLNDFPEDPVYIALAFKWLEFLVNRVGMSNLPDILDYYNKIGWISNKVVLKLLRLAKNLRIMINVEEIKPRDKLTPSEHITSLLYIEKLANRPIDPETLELLEIELRRIKKWVLELQTI